MAAKAQQQVCEVVCHIVSTVRKQREMNTSAQLLIQSKILD